LPGDCVSRGIGCPDHGLLDIQVSEVPKEAVEPVSRKLINDQLYAVHGAGTELNWVTYNTRRFGRAPNGAGIDHFNLGITYQQTRRPELIALREQIRRAVFACDTDLSDPHPTYAEIYGDPVTGAPPSKIYSWLNEEAPRRFDHTTRRYISDFVEMDIPDAMSCVRIAPLVWKLGFLDESRDTHWGSITITLEYMDSRDPSEDEIAQAEAGNWNRNLPEGVMPEVDRIMNETIPPYPTVKDEDGANHVYIDQLANSAGMPTGPLMELIEDSLDEPIFYKTMKMRLDSTPFGLRKAYMAVSLRHEDVSSAGNDSLVERFTTAFHEAEFALHYSRPLTQIDHWIGPCDEPPEPDSNLRLDFYKVAVRNIADTLMIELPEFWWVQQTSEDSWRCFQPDLSEDDDWGEFTFHPMFVEATEDKAVIFHDGVREGRVKLSYDDGDPMTAPLPEETYEGFLQQNMMRMAALPNGVGTLMTRLKIKEDRAEDLAFRALRLQIRRAVNRATSPLGPIYPRYGELHEV